MSALPPVEPPFPDPPAEEPDPEPPPELDESEPEPEVSELPGFPDCWASCSFCRSTLFTVAATLLLDNRSMILVLVSTMVLPLASVTSLSGASRRPRRRRRTQYARPHLPKHIQSWCQIAFDLMPHARFACGMCLHHGRHGHAIGRNASYDQHQRARQQCVRPRRQAQSASHAHRGAALV